ncbi:MAG: NAD(P)-binding domain-containing protein [Bacteroidales bacterium]|nr:NAD(P)-binding domain-containing protein [Bacteroidales bacterium]
MEQLLEEILIYGSTTALIVVLILYFVRRERKINEQTEQKIATAKEEGLFEPVSLHPVVDVKSCIRTGACIAACPEKDILGIYNGKATPVNASRCVGHGACFLACPTQAITLCIGTEKRGVDLPHVKPNFETNVDGIFIAGELGGMGLIKNAVEQGKQAAENAISGMLKSHQAESDLLIVGAGPAGISAALAAKKAGKSFIVLEQDSLGGTVFSFPRSKIIMTAPMDLPLFGKIKLVETSKNELLGIWQDVLSKHQIQIQEHCKVEAIEVDNSIFQVHTASGKYFTAHKIILAIGRRGTPRKLGVPGENLQKVAYRLLEPEDIKGKHILVVGGGDSAVESALLLCDQNTVTLSYRSEAFARLKARNLEKINQAIQEHKLDVVFSSQVIAIEEDVVSLKGKDEAAISLPNNLVYIFAGGELPTQFLEKMGINISKKYGEAILRH